jgi:hypothetical protein
MTIIFTADTKCCSFVNPILSPTMHTAWHYTTGKDIFSGKNQLD